MAIAIAKVLDHTVPSVVVTPGATLTCLQLSTTLSVSTTAVNPAFMWTGPNNFTSKQANPTVMNPGVYTVKVTDGSTGCTETGSTLVISNTLPPGAMATGGILDCFGTPVLLSGSSPTPGVTFSWTGPGIPTPTPNPGVITQPGIYMLLVTALNGCTSTAMAEVMQLQIPVISNVQVTNDQNSQGIGAISIAVSGTINYAVYWFGPTGSFLGSTQNLTQLSAGTYVGIVLTIDGCSDTISVTVDNLVAATEPDQSYLWEVVPNPASSFLDVHFRGDAWPETRLILFDMLGRRVLTGRMNDSKSARLEVKNLPAGHYQLLIQSQGQTVLRPVIIQR